MTFDAWKLVKNSYQRRKSELETRKAENVEARACSEKTQKH